MLFRRIVFPLPVRKRNAAFVFPRQLCARKKPCKPKNTLKFKPRRRDTPFSFSVFFTEISRGSEPVHAEIGQNFKVIFDYAPAISECPGFLACKVRQTIELGSHVMFIGEVVSCGVQDELFDEDGSMHLERAELVTKAHGVYQKATDVLGFFGYSVARPDVLKRRMSVYRKKK